MEIAAPFGVASVDSVQATGLDSFAVHIAPDSLRFSVDLFPPRTSGDSGGVIEVFFRAPVLRYGTTFRGWVSDSQRPLELAQPINRGDAASEIVSEVLTVRTLDFPPSAGRYRSATEDCHSQWRWDKRAD